MVQSLPDGSIINGSWSYILMYVCRYREEPYCIWLENDIMCEEGGMIGEVGNGYLYRHKGGMKRGAGV